MAILGIPETAPRNVLLNKLWIAALVLAPIVLWLLPAGFFDNGQSICPSKAFFDVECPGCGMTRAVMHMHHFNWREALYYNYAVLIVYPVLVVLWFVWLRAAIRQARK